MKKFPVAIATADVHLRHKPPRARISEPDWYEAMKRNLDFLKRVRLSFEADHNRPVPILYAGDIFDYWNVPPELINFAIENLPHGYSVAGQHDLPYHRFKDIKKSAYWTLVKSDVLISLNGRRIIDNSEWHTHVTGFSYGQPLTRCECQIEGVKIKIALIHKYIWSSRDNSYEGAPKKNLVSSLRRKLKGFDIAIFGDNHKAFLQPNIKGRDFSYPKILNCGPLIPQTIDLKNTTPKIYVIWSDKSIETIEVPTKHDRWIEDANLPTKSDVSIVADTLNNIFNKPVESFHSALKKLAGSKRVKKAVKRVLYEIVEEINDKREKV